MENLKVPQIDAAEKNARLNCPVCMENVRWRLPVATQCGHIFCGHCLVASVKHCSQKCPVCQQDLKEPLYLNILLYPSSSHSAKMGSVRRTAYRSRPVVVYDNPIEGRMRCGIIKNTIDVKDHEPYKCLVCKTCVLQRKPVAARCGHVFCQDCLADKAKCPYCMADIEKDLVTRIYL